jgi:hypothetical protein
MLIMRIGVLAACLVLASCGEQDPDAQMLSACEHKFSDDKSLKAACGCLMKPFTGDRVPDVEKQRIIAAMDDKDLFARDEYQYVARMLKVSMEQCILGGTGR